MLLALVWLWPWKTPKSPSKKQIAFLTPNPKAQNNGRPHCDPRGRPRLPAASELVYFPSCLRRVKGEVFALRGKRSREAHGFSRSLPPTSPALACPTEGLLGPRGDPQPPGPAPSAVTLTALLADARTAWARPVSVLCSRAQGGRDPVPTGPRALGWWPIGFLRREMPGACETCGWFSWRHYDTN